MRSIDRRISLTVILLFVFLSILIGLKIFEQIIMKDGFSKRQPLKNYMYIIDEIKKLHEGENIFLDNVFLRGQLILNFQSRTEIGNEELVKLCIILAIIVDKYLILHELQQEVSVRIFVPDNNGITIYRQKADRLLDDYYWWIDGKKYPVYTGL